MALPRIILTISLALVFTGCHSKARTYTAPVSELPISVAPEDIGVTAGQFPSFGTKELDATPTMGRFPTGIAVVQVDAMTSEAKGTHLIQLASMSVERGAYWNQLLDDLPALREVIIHRTTGLDPRGVPYRAFLKKSVEKNCGLCLIYARVHVNDAEVEYVGVLWDVIHEKPLNVYRTVVTIEECRRDDPKDADIEEDDDDYEEKKKEWTSEAEFRAEADLRQFVRYSIWDMARRDGFEPTTQPNPWQTDRPIYPRNPRWRLMEAPGSRGGN